MICVICLDRIYLFYHKCDCQCKTYYHRSCITNWYKIKEACPICKKHQITEKQQITPNIILLVSKWKQPLVVYQIFIFLILTDIYKKNLLLPHQILTIIPC